MTVASNILIGSNPSVPATTLAVTVDGTLENLAVAAGKYYLDDPTASLSLMQTVAAALVTHTKITACTIKIRQDRKTQMTLTTTAGTTAIDWSSDTTVRDMLGYSQGNLAGANAYTSASISKYLWSPMRLEITKARLDTQGEPEHDTVTTESGDGVVVAREHNTWRSNELRWPNTANARVWTTSEAGGEYIAFWDMVLRRFNRFKVYRNFNDAGTVSDSTEHTLSTAYGPYKPKHSRGPYEFNYRREIEHVDTRHEVVMRIRSVPEYS